MLFMQDLWNDGKTIISHIYFLLKLFPVEKALILAKSVQRDFNYWSYLKSVECLCNLKMKCDQV